jgi:hypothetical protein
LVGYAIQGDQQSPVYATVSLTLDVGKSKGRSAYKKQNPDVKKVLRCYTSDRHFKNRVISNTAVDHSRLVKCLKPYGKGWPDKVKDDFCIEYATLVQECSTEKLQHAQPRNEELSDDDDRSAVDPEEVAQNFFDVDKAMSEHELGQAAEILQRTFNLREAPSIDLLQSIREWKRQTGPPVQSGSQHSSSVVDSNSQSPPPQPIQSAPDDDSEHEYERRMNSVWDDLETLNTTR